MSWSEIKYALNSTVGTDMFQSLDQYISSSISAHLNGTKTVFDKPGTYTYTVPKGINTIYVTACGGGGGGGAICSTSKIYNGGGGGGGGAYTVKYPIVVASNDTLTIIVGKGGAGVADTDRDMDGSDGGDTIIKKSGIKNYLTLHGGKGGGTAKSVSEGSGTAGVGGTIDIHGGFTITSYGGNGGNGGNGGCYTSPTRYATNGSDAFGSGGITYTDDTNSTKRQRAGGGGGGSLGSGGYLTEENSQGDHVPSKGKGAGGGGVGASADGASSRASTDGSDGYVEIITGSIEKETGIRLIQRGVVTVDSSQSSNYPTTVTLSGFTNVSKMIYILTGGTKSYTYSNYRPTSSIYVYDMTIDSLILKDNSTVGEDPTISYQVIEFY